MTIGLDILAVAVAAAGATLCLFKALADSVKPTEESMKKVQKYQKIIDGITHKKYKGIFTCEAFKDIKEDDIGAFIDVLAERYTLQDKTKQSILDILRTGKRRGNYSEIQHRNGKTVMFYHDVIAESNDGMINFAFATYDISFVVEAKIELWYLFGFIPIKKKVTGENLPINENEKEILETYYRAKLFEIVKQKCKKEALPSNKPLQENNQN